MKIKILHLITFLFIMSMAAHSQNIKEFDFSFKSGDDTYNSKTKRFTKIMAEGKPITFRLRLNKAEKKMILQKLKDIDFWSYPDAYKFIPADSNAIIRKMLNEMDYTLNILTPQMIKSVTWHDYTASCKSKNNQYEKLMELNLLIVNIIHFKKAYIQSDIVKGYYK